MSLDIQSFELPPIGTQCYAVIHPGTGSIAVFDAPLNAYATVERLAVREGYRIEGLYFTHGHWDHTLDGMRFNDAGVEVHAHKGDKEFYENPQSMSAFSMPGLPMPPVKVDHWLEDGQRLQILGRDVEIRHVPGHSPGSILYWFINDKFAVSGDALFNGSIGRTDFPGCSFEQLAGSVRDKIYTLPDDTVIHPGHGPATRVGDEASSNPFVAR